MILPNLWHTPKAVIRGKFIALSAYKNLKRKVINNLTTYFKELEKKQQKPKNTRRRNNKD